MLLLLQQTSIHGKKDFQLSQRTLVVGFGGACGTVFGPKAILAAKLQALDIAFQIMRGGT